MMTPEEKRKYPRVILKIEDGYFGNFKLPNADIIIAPIVNLSAGGLNMSVPDNAKDQIKEGDVLLLQSIAGGANLAFLSDIKAEIRWIKDLKTPGYVSVGCKFKELSEAVHDQLVKLVHSERMARGQYD
jgi:c-di-GMP-binding flagellar brake protein YcgR